MAEFRAEQPEARPEEAWLILLQRWQFETNCLASCAIEYPRLRPVLAARIRAMDGEDG